MKHYLFLNANVKNKTTICLQFFSSGPISFFYPSFENNKPETFDMTWKNQPIQGKKFISLLS